MGSVSISDIMARDPCPPWSRERVEAAWKEAGLRERASARTLYRKLRGRIPASALIWLLIDSRLLSDRTLRLWACDCAARALLRESRAGRRPDQRSYAAVRVGRRFALGSVMRDEWSAAWDVAWDAWRVTRALSAVRAAWLASMVMEWDAVLAARAAMAMVRTATEAAWQLNRLGRYVTGPDRRKATGG